MLIALWKLLITIDSGQFTNYNLLMNTNNTYLRYLKENSDDQEEFDGQEIFVPISDLGDSGVPIDDFGDDMESDGFLYKKIGENYEKIS